VGTDAGQVAFVGAGVALVQQAGHGKAEHGVAQELQAFVVVGAKAAVGQCPHQQVGALEAMAKPALEGIERSVHGGGAAVNARCRGT
jgi:hypothetical protein